MADHFCTAKLDVLAQLVRDQGTSVLPFCVLHLVFSLVATLGNLLVIRALWKALSMPLTVKKLFLSLACSDLSVGMLPQLMSGVIFAVTFKMTSTGDYNFVLFCPTILTVFYYLFCLLATASLLNVTAIAVDRLLAVSLHLRYQELVTSKRVDIALVSLWLTSAVTALLYIFLPKGNEIIVAVISIVALFLTTVAYIRIFNVVKYHQNQIDSQLQMQNAPAVELLRQRKSAYNALFVYIVFLACYLPFFLSIILYATKSLGISILVATRASILLIFLNSSLNPLVYCWRYREIREIVKSTVKKIFRINENMT